MATLNGLWPGCFSKSQTHQLKNDDSRISLFRNLVGIQWCDICKVWGTETVRKEAFDKFLVIALQFTEDGKLIFSN